MSRMRWRMLAGCALLVSCATSRFGMNGPVNHVRSPHFDVVGNLPSERLELEAIRFEQLFDVFTTFFQAEPSENQRLPLVVMRAGEVNEFDEHAGGFVGRFRLEPYLVTSVGEDSRFFGINAHELVHMLSGYALPEQPRWFSEGIAEYFEDAHFDRGGIKMGTWRPVSTWVSLEALLKWDENPVPLNESDGHYQTARAVLFYLANRDEPRLRALISGLRSRSPPAELYAEVFPFGERDALMKQVKDFVDEGKFSAWRTDLLRTANVEKLAPLEAWEVELVRGRTFQSLQNGRRAVASFRAAREKAPQPMPPTLAAEFIWRDLPAPADPSSPEVQLAWADAIDRSYRERLAAAEAATKGLPNSAFAWHFLGGARFAVRDFAGALAAYDRALRLAPQAEEVLFARVKALMKLSKCSEARQTLRLAFAARESADPTTVEAWEKSVNACK